MVFNFGLKSSLLLIFFFHGIVFSGLLFLKGWRNDNKASLWLGFFVLLCALYITPFMCGYAGWYARDTYREILFFIPFQQVFLLGPVIYFYTQSLLNKSFRLVPKDLFHFLPAILYLLYSLIVFVTDALILDEYYFYADGRDKDLAFWYQMSGLVSMMFYLFLSIRYYRVYKNIAFQTVSFAETILFGWVQRFLVAFLIILILRILFFILNPEWGQFGSKFWYYLCFSVLFYYISISGYANTVRAMVTFRTSLFSSDPDYLPKESEEIEAESESSKDEFSTEVLEQWKTKIEKLMNDERVFENPTLTLADVSAYLETNPRKVSQIINQGFGINFNDFINRYRTEAVIEKLASGKHDLQNLLTIALDSGFNSKSTFNRAFKKHTSLTPKEFLKKNHKK